MSLVVGFHLQVIAAELWFSIGHEVIWMVGFERASYFFEVSIVTFAVRDSVPLESLDGQFVG